MNYKFGLGCLVVAAIIAIFTALAHLSCIYFGPACYSAQMAPPIIIKSAEAGTLLAPLGTILVSAIFVILGLYALSAAKIIAQLPLLKIGIYSIAFVCVVRGLLPILFWFAHPEKISQQVIYVGLIWLLTGLLYFFGYKTVNK